MAEDPDSAYSEAAVALVSNMTGIFLGGGEPWRLAAALMVEEGRARRDSPVMAAVRAVLGRGGLLGGTSAGAEAMTDLGLVTGGESWEALVGEWGTLNYLLSTISISAVSRCGAPRWTRPWTGMSAVTSPTTRWAASSWCAVSSLMLTSTSEAAR